ncbi:FadR/GntR family transcriptional regulator [Streptomyces odontomachi]|uniref:FadR/GntR family transcriptional regulator n=1 Tax=Streptomyces odontomachi TaxID=2944940 RepID=UPI00210CEAD1|nr:FadR/GntR family transcriptional regulator [Streptomyces sp. ODS25]
MILLHCTACDQAIPPDEPYKVHDLDDDTGYTYTHPTCPPPSPAVSTDRPRTPPAPHSPRLLPATDRATARRGRGLHGHLVHQLGQMITSGQLGDGPLVPDDVCHTFDVSRTVVRESLRALEAKGLISARPNVGTRVRPASDWNLLDADIITWRSLGPQADDQRRELRELRWTIETCAARLATHRANQETRAMLSASVRPMTWSLHGADPVAFARADDQFHTLLVQASGNQMMRHLHAIVTKTVPEAPADPTPHADCHLSPASVAQHDAVTTAVLHHDANSAEAAMRTLLTGLLGTDTAVPPRDDPHSRNRNRDSTDGEEAQPRPALRTAP